MSDHTDDVTVIVLAAGGGTRMRSKRSKLLHTLAGRPLLAHAIDAAEEVRPRRLVAVVGVMADQVQPYLTEHAPNVRVVHQSDDAYGTGHAVRCALAELGELGGEVLVTYGDVPLLTGATLSRLLASHRSQRNAVTVLTAAPPDPTGYGRIVRDAAGAVLRIVEERDATDDERAITEINTGIGVFDAAVLADGLAALTADNAQGEYLLTDVLGHAASTGRRVGALVTDDTWEVEGVNDRVQLADLGRELNRRICERWMRDGVTIVDPATTWIAADVTLAPDVTLLPGTHLEGATVVAADATIGPDTTLVDCEVGEGATVARSQAMLAVIGAGASVGPYAHLRPGSELAERVHLGAFTETKNARLGAGAKMGHLAYAGDAAIGPDANIGAGVVFANYDGIAKHHSEVGEAAFVGSSSVLIAPVTVGAGAYVAAGSAVTDDVAPGELAVARGRQRDINGWVAAKRPGTVSAAAAQRAGASGDHVAATRSHGDATGSDAGQSAEAAGPSEPATRAEDADAPEHN